MEIWRGRPEITGTDHPTTVYKAITHSLNLWREERPGEAEWWAHRAHNAWETLRGDFGFLHPDQEPWRPDGRSRLIDMSVDELKFALVGWGVRLADEDPVKYHDEINRVDDVLRAIDKALDRKKYQSRD